MTPRGLLALFALLAHSAYCITAITATNVVTVGQLHFALGQPAIQQATLFTPRGAATTDYNGDIVVPPYVTDNNGQSYAVTTIDEATFDNAIHITSVTLPSTLKTIGITSFRGCINMQTVNLPEELTSIGLGAFMNCKLLTSITLPSTLTSIANQAFTACTKLEHVTLNNGLVTLENGAFWACAVRSVELPATLENIGYKAFAECPNLTSITIPAPLKTLDSKAFLSSTALRNIHIVYAGDNREAANEVLSSLQTQLQNYTLTATYACRPVVEWPLTTEQLAVQPGDRLPQASVTPQECAVAYALIGTNNERTPLAADNLASWSFQGEAGDQVILEAYCPSDNNDRVDALPVRRTFTLVGSLPQLTITWAGTANTPIPVRGGETLHKATVNEGYTVTYTINGTEIDPNNYHFTAQAEEYNVTVIATAPGDAVTSSDAEPVTRTFRVAALTKPTITWAGTANTPIPVRGGETLPKATVNEGYTVTYTINGTEIDPNNYHFTAQAEEYNVTVIATAPGDGITSTNAEPVTRTFRVAALTKPTITWAGTANTPIPVHGGETLPKASVNEGYTVTYTINGTDINADNYHFTAQAEEYNLTVVATASGDGITSTNAEPVTRTFRVAALTKPTITWEGTSNEIINVNDGDALPRATAGDDYVVTYSIDGQEVGPEYRFAAQDWAHNVVVVATIKDADGDNDTPLVRTFRVAAASKPTIVWSGTAEAAITVHGGDALPTATVNGGYLVTYSINGQEIDPDYHFEAKNVAYEVVVVATASEAGAEPQTRTFRVEGTDALGILRHANQHDATLHSLDGRPVRSTTKPGIYIRNGRLLRMR